MNKFFHARLTLLAALILGLTACEPRSPAESPAAQAPATEPAATETAAVQAPQLIDRSVLFGNPVRFQGRLSPDGTKMSFTAPLDGVMNVWVGDRGDFDSVRPITNDKGRGIPAHFWALDSHHVLYTRDEGAFDYAVKHRNPSETLDHLTDHFFLGGGQSAENPFPVHSISLSALSGARG